MRGSRERGFTMVELIMAMGIAALLVAMLGPLLAAALRQARLSRDHEVAAALGSGQVEEIRAILWEELAMSWVDEDAPLLAGSGTARLDAAAAGLGSDEALVVSEDGLVTPQTVITMEGLDYTVWRYVSAVDDGVRRVVVVVAWVGQDGTNRYQTSALVSALTAGGFGTTTTIPPATTTTSPGG